MKKAIHKFAVEETMPALSKNGQIVRRAERYKDNLFKREAIRQTLEKRVAQNLEPILLILSICLLTACNLFFNILPGSIGVLWIVNVVTALFTTYRMTAGMEDEAVVRYRQMLRNFPVE